MKIVTTNPIWLVVLGLFMAAQVPAFASQDEDSEKVKKVVIAFHHALKSGNAEQARGLLATMPILLPALTPRENIRTNNGIMWAWRL